MQEAYASGQRRPGQCWISLVALLNGKAIPWPNGFWAGTADRTLYNHSRDPNGSHRDLRRL